MRVFINVPESIEPVALELDATATIDLLKRKLQDELSCPVSHQTLFKNEERLDNGRTLQQCGVDHGDTLYLILPDRAEPLKRDKAGVVPEGFDKRGGARRLTVPMMQTQHDGDISGLPQSVQQHFAALRMADKLTGGPDAKADTAAGYISGGSGQFKYGACSIKGMEYMNPKKENQDAYFIIEPFKKTGILLGMFDGHGAYGKLASNYARDKLPAILEKGKIVPGKSMDAFREAFIKTDKEMKREYKDRVGYSGTTAIVAMLIGDDLYVGNAGDSRAVMATIQDNVVKAVELSDDHKPDLPEERKRIEKCGGRVEPARDMETGEYFLPMRVWLKQINLPGLAMSRSLGDAVSHSIGVTPEAEVRQVKIDRSTDKFLVLATDGVWEFMTSQQVVDFVAQHLHRGPQEAAERLVKEAYLRWEEEGEGVADDTSCIIFLL
eukprot:tig00000940_g5542.t1